MAEDNSPGLIFSGPSGLEYSVELSNYNRISFGPDAMTLTHSSGESPELQLLYSSYNKFIIGDPLVSALDEVELIDRSLRYDAGAACLRLSCDNAEMNFTVGIFNPQGVLLLQARMHSGDELPVGSLPSGIYIAIAANENYTMNLKFAK